MGYQYDVFISYSKEISPFVDKLEKYLLKRNIKVWRDKTSIEIGEDFNKAIGRGIAESRILCLILSPAAVNSDWVIGEYMTFRRYAEGDQQRRIIPILMNGMEPPIFLKRWQYIKVKDKELNKNKVTEKEIETFDIVYKLICDKAQIKEKIIERLDDLLFSAKESIIVFGHTLDKFSSNKDVQDAIRELLRNKKEVTFILLNPFSNYAKAHEPFHLIESDSPSMAQTEKTIKYFVDLIATEPENKTLKVYLSNYMPRFRTIILDDKYCVLNLYMYHNDVNNTPEMIFNRESGNKDSLYIDSIGSSIHELLTSEHAIPIIENGIYLENWKNIKASNIVQHCLETQCCMSKNNCKEFQNIILCFQNNDDGKSVREANICDEKYCAGLFTLDQIHPGAKFLKEPCFFRDWLKKVVREDWDYIGKVKPNLLSGKDFDNIYNKVEQIMEFRALNGRDLKERVYYQEYSDIIHRIIIMMLTGNPDYEINLYPELTIDSKSLILKVIDYLDDKGLELRQWLLLSIVAGLIGVDKKSQNAATSYIHYDHAIPLQSKKGSLKYEVERISEKLIELIKEAPKIESINFFFHILETNVLYDLNIISFPDDYIESIFLMKYYDKLLEHYPKVKISFVPKSIRCSNDLTYVDTLELLPHFTHLNGDQFSINAKGPKLGGVNLLKLSDTVKNDLENALIVDVRGARNYEMLQGINKQTFFGFTVCRDFSISTVGMIPGKHAPIVYIHQTPKEHSFEGFEHRNKRIVDGYMFSRETVYDKSDKWNGGHFNKMDEWPEAEKERFNSLKHRHKHKTNDFNFELIVKEYLNEVKGRILVLGCGSGKDVRYLTEHNNIVYGIDNNAEAIISAKNDNIDIQYRFFIEDIYNIKNIMTDQFDGIIANTSLLHLLDRNHFSDILAQTKKRLKPGGRLFITMLKKYGPVRLPLGELKRIFDKNKLLISNINGNIIQMNDDIASFEVSELHATHLTEALMNDLEKYASIENDEIDDDHRWFIYYDEIELEKIFVNAGFAITDHRTENHVSYPYVKWLVYMLENK